MYIFQPIEILSSKGSRVVWMLLEPLNEEKLPKHWSGISNHAVDQYNWAAHEVGIFSSPLCSRNTVSFNF